MADGVLAMTSAHLPEGGPPPKLLDRVRTAVRLRHDSRRTENRTQELKDLHGIGYCNITKCCTKVCPEHITITDNAIIPLKERVVDEHYDPLAKLVKIFRKKK